MFQRWYYRERYRFELEHFHRFQKAKYLAIGLAIGFALGLVLCWHLVP